MIYPRNGSYLDGNALKCPFGIAIIRFMKNEDVTK